MRLRLDEIFSDDLAADADVRWRVSGERAAVGVVELGRSVEVGISDLREDITRGQIVARWVLEGSDGGGWRTLAEGQTIGYRKLDRFTAASVRRVRLTILDALERPRPVRIGLYGPTPGAGRVPAREPQT